MRRVRTRVSAAVLVAGVLLGTVSQAGARPRPAPTATRGPIIAVVPAVDLDEAYAIEQVARAEWVAGVQRAEWVAGVELAAWVDGVRRAEVERARQAPRSSAPAVPSTSAAGHSDAWWQGVAVCEQSGRNDPFYGYFSIMDGSAGGLDWSTQVEIANGIIRRAGDRAWAASCVAAGYARSPAG